MLLDFILSIQLNNIYSLIFQHECDSTIQAREQTVSQDKYRQKRLVTSSIPHRNSLALTINMDDQACPKCKTTKYRNPSLKLMVNICGHTLCESCVDLLFIKGLYKSTTTQWQWLCWRLLIN